MASVKRLVVSVFVVVSACSAPAAVTTVSSPLPGTQPPPPVSTTLDPLEVEVQDCSSPPVTFSPLCEIYELLQTWYVDAPVDAEALADVAMRGLQDFTTTETEEPPRTLFCAIPDEAFSGLCDVLASMVTESQVPVGPAVEAAMTHMIDLGLGPFTYYLPPDQAGSVRINGIVGGIGVVLDARDAAGSKCTQITAACPLEIAVVLEDNPGATAGLTVGDIITAVDGEPVDGKGFTAIVSLIAGEESGPVMLTVRRGDSHLDFEIERAELVIPTVEAAIPRSDVGYIKIPDFEFDVPDLVADALADISAENPSTLIVDLRDNPGGYVDAIVDVADQFINGGTVMVSEAGDERLEYEATPGGVATSQRLVVLVNQGTASAAEILAGALRDRRGAPLVGTGTFGKDTVQIPFDLRNGGEFYVAVARWSTPDGDTAGNGGLTPDREVDWPTGATTEEIVEIALEAAS
ncbi:MAG TPA: S41 family peptidase [Acidimicrobiia bacterium]